MKSRILLLSIICFTIFQACSNHKNKIDQAIKKYLDENLDDPSNYEFVSSFLDTFTTCDLPMNADSLMLAEEQAAGNQMPNQNCIPLYFEVIHKYRTTVKGEKKLIIQKFEIDTSFNVKSSKKLNP